MTFADETISIDLPSGAVRAVVTAEALEILSGENPGATSAAELIETNRKLLAEVATALLKAGTIDDDGSVWIDETAIDGEGDDFDGGPSLDPEEWDSV